MKAGESGRKRIAIFTTNDYVWAFPTWKRTIPELQKHHDLAGLLVFPDKIGSMRGLQATLWYLKTFGVLNFLLLGLYALRAHLTRLLSPIRTWEGLAKHSGVAFSRERSPNAEPVCAWVKQHEIDIVVIMVGDILQGPILEAPRIGIINKHAAMLPSCRGVFPFFWARLRNLPLGITFHRVDAGIDTGRILVQKSYEEAKPVSMLRFYMDVFAMYPAMAVTAVQRLVEGQFTAPRAGIESSYFSFPEKNAYRLFAGDSHRIATFCDLFYRPGPEQCRR